MTFGPELLFPACRLLLRWRFQVPFPLRPASEAQNVGSRGEEATVLTLAQSRSFSERLRTRTGLRRLLKFLKIQLVEIVMVNASLFSERGSG